MIYLVNVISKHAHHAQNTQKQVYRYLKFKFYINFKPYVELRSFRDLLTKLSNFQ